MIILDADLELDPRDYLKLVPSLENGMADAVYGSRFLTDQSRQASSWHVLANRFLTALSNRYHHFAGRGKLHRFVHFLVR